MSNQNRPGPQAPPREGSDEHKQGQSRPNEKAPQNPQKQPGQQNPGGDKTNRQK